VFSGIGSAASLAGLLVSLLGLGFAILQLRKLRGETRAARDAAEAAERAVRRDLTISEVAALREKAQELKDAHRRGDRSTAFVCYRDVKSSLINIELRHPNLTDGLRQLIRTALSAITDMERYTDSIEGGLPLEQVSRFNNTLSDLDTELVTELQRRMPGDS
jgi:hypothetical protein